MILQHEQWEGGTKTLSLFSGAAGKLPRRFLQHSTDEPVAAQSVCGQWVAIDWSLSVVTGHCRLLENQFSTNLAQSQCYVSGLPTTGSISSSQQQGGR